MLFGPFSALLAAGQPCDADNALSARPTGTGQSLLSALYALAKASGYHLVTIPDLVKGERVAWQPDCSLDPSLLEHHARQLLTPRGLAYRIIDDTLVVFRAEPAPKNLPPPAPVPAPAIAEVVVEASPHAVQAASGGGNQFGRYQGRADAVLDYERLHSLGITDLASALELISGVKLEQERYAVIRGMKGRYQSVRLNGATIPSLEPSGQRVPLDIFPVNILNQVDLRKSVFADAPGNASAGVVNIETRRIPEEPSLTLVSGGAYRSGTTGSPALRGYTGERDWLGYDDGGRALPAVLAENAHLGSPDNWSVAAREAAGEAMVESAQSAQGEHKLGIYRGDAGVDGLLNLSGGRAWQRGRHHFGLTGSVGYQNEWQQREIFSQMLNRYSVAAEDDDDTEGSLYATEDAHHRRLENVINLNALLAFGYGLDERHHLGGNVLLLRQSVNRSEQIETRERDGFGAYDGSASLRSLSNWTETQMRLGQLYGRHFVGPEERMALNWHLTSAQSRYTRPFDVRYRYGRSSASDSYRFEPGYNHFEVAWEDMREKTLSAGVNGAWAWELADWSGELKTGLELLDARQNGYLLEYTLIAKGEIEQDRPLMESANPADILTPETIIGAPGSDGFLLDDDVKLFVSPPALDGSFYAAAHRNRAGFLLADTRIGEHWQLVLGARRERDGVKADFWDAQPQEWVPLLDGARTLYSAALGFDFSSQQELRLGYSETAVWPGVNELMPRRYEDTDLRIEITGNPELEVAAARNWDLRWQWRDEALGLDIQLLGFYKTIGNAIEGVFFDPVIANNHSFNIYSYANTGSARLYGGELELDYQRVFAESHKLVWQSSYAGMASQVAMPPDRWNAGKTRPLQGQPEYLASLQLQYQHLDSGRSASLLYKRAGRELDIVSNNLDVPDVYRDPYDSLTLAFNTPLVDGVYATLSVENLLDDTRHFAQGRETFMEYQVGRRYQLRVAVEF